jgi:hypothetical protein
MALPRAQKLFCPYAETRAKLEKATLRQALDNLIGDQINQPPVYGQRVLGIEIAWRYIFQRSNHRGGSVT